MASCATKTGHCAATQLAGLFLFVTRLSVKDFIHQPVVLGFQRRQIVIALGIFGDLFNRLLRVAGQNFVEQLSSRENIPA